MDALNLVWPLKPAQPTQIAIAVNSPESSGDARSIAKSIFSIFCNSAEYHVAVGQSRCVGEAEWNTVDETQVKSVDGGWLDDVGALVQQRIEY